MSLDEPLQTSDQIPRMSTAIGRSRLEDGVAELARIGIRQDVVVAQHQRVRVARGLVSSAQAAQGPRRDIYVPQRHVSRSGPVSRLEREQFDGAGVLHPDLGTSDGTRTRCKCPLNIFNRLLVSQRLRRVQHHATALRSPVRLPGLGNGSEPDSHKDTASGGFAPGPR